MGGIMGCNYEAWHWVCILYINTSKLTSLWQTCGYIMSLNDKQNASSIIYKFQLQLPKSPRSARFRYSLMPLAAPLLKMRSPTHTCIKHLPFSHVNQAVLKKKFVITVREWENSVYTLCRLSSPTNFTSIHLLPAREESAAKANWRRGERGKTTRWHKYPVAPKRKLNCQGDKHE